MTGSATPISPATEPSITKNITVCPSFLSSSERAANSPAAMPNSSNNRRLPSATCLPSTAPTTPFPVIERKSRASVSFSPLFSAPLTIAAASGCSLPRSRLAARRRISLSFCPVAGTNPARCGLPSVSVPVLSTTRVSTFSNTSSASAFLINTPAIAPRPVPTIIDIGVAKPRAQGQAMINTATALSSP